MTSRPSVARSDNDLQRSAPSTPSRPVISLVQEIKHAVESGGQHTLEVE
jgi:hypothetical protein